MEESINKLVVAVENLNSISFGDIIAILSLLASWITIVFLLRDKFENNRPYLQITFELIKANLACVVVRNVGKVPLTIKNIEFEEEFVKQLPKSERIGLEKNKINNMNIFPGKQWIICLGVIIPEILEKYDNKILKIEYAYSKLNREKEYFESAEIDFEQYSRFLVYISEIDELKEINTKIEKNLNKINKELVKIYAVVEKHQNIEDTHIKHTVVGYKKEDLDE